MICDVSDLISLPLCRHCCHLLSSSCARLCLPPSPWMAVALPCALCSGDACMIRQSNPLLFFVYLWLVTGAVLDPLISAPCLPGRRPFISHPHCTSLHFTLCSLRLRSAHQPGLLDIFFLFFSLSNSFLLHLFIGHILLFFSSWYSYLRSRRRSSRPLAGGSCCGSSRKEIGERNC